MIAKPGESERYARVWRDIPHITPRQAYAISVQLKLWNDLYIGEWLRSPDEPLHRVPPFDEFDLRIMMLVGENRAWAEAVGRRCAVVVNEIGDGILPCDRPGPYIDEVLFGTAILTASAWVSEDPSVVEDVPAREIVAASDDDEDVYWIRYDGWGELEDEFDERARWADYDVPQFRGSPAIRHLLNVRPPLTWLDSWIEDDPVRLAHPDVTFGPGK